MKSSPRKSFCLLYAASLSTIPITISAFSNARRKPIMKRSKQLQMNFFQDLLKDAFENDPSLSKDKSQGQLEDGTSDPSSRQQLTEVQERFLQSAAAASKARISAPVSPELLQNTKWSLDLYLSGVPTSRDPSSDLYGSKINISSRDRQLPLGAQLPEQPSVTVTMQLLPDGVCVCEPSTFTKGDEKGQWKLSDDGKNLRFSISVKGYSRTVTTKGSIQSVYWSDRESVTTTTSSSYVIPKGFVYADAIIGYGRPGEIVLEERDDSGVLRLEQSSGLLGAATKMVVCGKFTAQMIQEEE